MTRSRYRVTVVVELDDYVVEAHQRRQTRELVDIVADALGTVGNVVEGGAVRIPEDLWRRPWAAPR